MAVAANSFHPAVWLGSLVHSSFAFEICSVLSPAPARPECQNVKRNGGEDAIYGLNHSVFALFPFYKHSTYPMDGWGSVGSLKEALYEKGSLDWVT